jgi:hypothetical protein
MTGKVKFISKPIIVTLFFLVIVSVALDKGNVEPTQESTSAEVVNTCPSQAQSTNTTAELSLTDTSTSVAVSSITSSSTKTAAGKVPSRSRNVPSSSDSTADKDVLLPDGVTSKDCLVSLSDIATTENELRLLRRKNNAVRKASLKQERARLAALLVDASRQEAESMTVKPVEAVDDTLVTTNDTVTDVVEIAEKHLSIDLSASNIVQEAVSEVTDSVNNQSDQKIFTPSLSKTMRKKMKIAKKRSVETAELQDETSSDLKKAKTDDEGTITVGDIVIPMSIARTVNTSVAKDPDVTAQTSVAKSTEIASNKSVVLTVQAKNDNNSNSNAEIPIGPAASKGVRKRLKARMKAEEELAQNPESAEQTNLLKADHLKKAVQANQVKQKLETLSSKVTKYLPPNLRTAGMSASKNATSGSSSNQSCMGKYGPKTVGSSTGAQFGQGKYTHISPSKYRIASTLTATANPNRQHMQGAASSSMGISSLGGYSVGEGYQQAASATSWGTQQQGLALSQQHQDHSQYGQRAQHASPSVTQAPYQYDYTASQQAHHTYLDPQSTHRSPYSTSPAIASHYAPSMSSNAGLYAQHQQQYSQLAHTAAAGMTAQQYAQGGSAYTPSASMQQYVQYSAVPLQQSYHQLQNSNTPATQNSLHLSAASYGLGTAYTYATPSFSNNSHSKSITSSPYVDAKLRQS